MKVKDLKKAIKYLPDENNVYLELDQKCLSSEKYYLVTSEGKYIGPFIDIYEY